MEFVSSENEFSFSPEWLLIGRGETRIDLEMQSLQVPVGISADTRVDDGKKVVGRQCLAMPLSEPVIEGFRRNLENFKPEQVLSPEIMDKVVTAYFNELIAGGKAVEVLEPLRSTLSADTVVKVFRTCQENSLEVGFSIYAEEDMALMRSPWVISVARRKGMPERLPHQNYGSDSEMCK